MNDTQVWFNPIVLGEGDNKRYAATFRNRLFLYDLHTFSERPLFVFEEQNIALNVPHMVVHFSPIVNEWTVLSKWEPHMGGYHSMDGFQKEKTETKIIARAYTKSDIREIYPPLETPHGMVGIWHGIPIWELEYSHTQLEVCDTYGQGAEFVVWRHIDNDEINISHIDRYYSRDIYNHAPYAPSTFIRSKKT